MVLQPQPLHIMCDRREHNVGNTTWYGQQRAIFTPMGSDVPDGFVECTTKFLLYPYVLYLNIDIILYSFGASSSNNANLTKLSIFCYNVTPSCSLSVSHIVILNDFSHSYSIGAMSSRL